MNHALTRTDATFSPPVMEARRWLDGLTFAADRPLINVSQAAPVAPPPAPMIAAMAEALNTPETHLYGPVLGLPALRARIAADWSAAYGGTIAPAQVAITAGCNQAFCATITALTTQGDEVILPTPWYFNHKMWLDMAGVDAVPLPCEADMMPDPDRAAALISPRTRAIVLVTPNNPTGMEYPPALIAAFRDLARAHGLKLIVDETYRDFHSSSDAPHDLFTDPDWDDVLIHLYSFSKAYRLTGHRTGAVIASTKTLADIEKFLDTVAICAPQLGQIAALWGMENLGQWLAGERDEILARRAAMFAGRQALARAGWTLHSAGAYFAYASHPSAKSSADLAPQLVRDAGILMLPGTMFTPAGGANGARQMRIAFANLDTAGIGRFIDRLTASSQG
ncbi:aminotransferase [Pseudooceanicola sediminis]|uniref:aspartate transaminase n=1 Tax=Pseudooceanicola sediminis TaxID=2211117 RepID=A0A399J339_9RHOB|nr:aminotransferase [Pseudooceanicola sediminis]KAA2317326.1 aminotransferase [Puniceibacterium sp. HSS470]RII39680.1 aminotransferase [Pseudooceanicola sediminis]|tara:strand:+ start:1720 stop:2901 length:1182 start_codon:yes stop_codon:yes gene_type:complete